MQLLEMQLQNTGDATTVDSHYLEFQGLTETLRDIRTSTYQSWESE